MAFDNHHVDGTAIRNFEREKRILIYAKIFPKSHLLQFSITDFRNFERFERERFLEVYRFERNFSQNVKL